MFAKYYKNIYQTLCQLKTINSVRNIGNQTQNHGRFQEVEIEVPWGKICGKYRGPQDVEPIIAVHGICNNAGSFDPLATRLPENVSLFAMDLPGHGLSSWIPRGMQYTTLFYIQTFDRVKEHFKIDQLKLLGHSLGGVLSFLYVSLYSNDVKYIITFDIYKPWTFKASITLAQIAKYRERFFKNEKSLIPRTTYTDEEAISNMIKVSKNSLDEATSKMLIQRGMTKQPDGRLYFNNDPRVEFCSFDMASSVDYMNILAEQIRCPFMFVKGDHFDQIDNMERYYEVLKVIEEHSEDFQNHSVSGLHHFHMSNPEPVATLINPFILKHKD